VLDRAAVRVHVKSHAVVQVLHGSAQHSNIEREIHLAFSLPDDLQEGHTIASCRVGCAMLYIHAVVLRYLCFWKFLAYFLNGYRRKVHVHSPQMLSLRTKIHLGPACTYEIVAYSEKLGRSPDDAT
jgi:hypothetical protein